MYSGTHLAFQFRVYYRTLHCPKRELLTNLSLHLILLKICRKSDFGRLRLTCIRLVAPAARPVRLHGPGFGCKVVDSSTSLLQDHRRLRPSKQTVFHAIVREILEHKMGRQAYMTRLALVSCLLSQSLKPTPIMRLIRAFAESISSVG